MRADIIPVEWTPFEFELDDLWRREKNNKDDIKERGYRGERELETRARVLTRVLIPLVERGGRDLSPYRQTRADFRLF